MWLLHMNLSVSEYLNFRGKVLSGITNQLIKKMHFYYVGFLYDKNITS